MQCLLKAGMWFVLKLHKLTKIKVVSNKYLARECSLGAMQGQGGLSTGNLGNDGRQMTPV